MITYQIKMDLQSERTMFSDIVLTSGDTKAYRLEFSFYSDGVRQNVSGCSLCIRAKRADDSIVLDMGEVESNGKAVYDVKSSVYSIPGRLSMEVALASENGTYVTTKEVIMSVREGYGNGGLGAQNTMPILAKLTEQSARAEQAAADADRVSNMAFSVMAINYDEEPTVVKTDDGENITLEFGIPRGEVGPKGGDGYTPQKGIDYYTEEEKEEFVQIITDEVTGGIEIALDNIIVIQNSLIGGGSV